LQRRSLAIDDGDFVVGYVGRLIKEKGIDDLISANNVIMSSQVEVRTRLLFVGDGPEKRRLAELAPDVIVVSPGGVLATVPYYRAMDVLVLPSRTQGHWKEQFGRVLIEAMSSAVPVIGSDSGAIPEVVGDAGLIFPEGDVKQLVKHLRMLADDRELRLKLSERGLQRVNEHFTAARIAQQTLDIYAARSPLAQEDAAS
jgi:glycosyltransferase involved in cell wall biosynthesis